jgi:Kef-type K+ transport system membrane component KefB
MQVSQESPPQQALLDLLDEGGEDVVTPKHKANVLFLLVLAGLLALAGRLAASDPKAEDARTLTASSHEPIVHLPLLVRFALVLAIFLLVPPLCRRVRIPPAVGLLFAGVCLGPSGLHTLPNAAPVAEFFAEIGKLLLMFFAGLEIDLSQFRRTGVRSLIFGALTFSLPLVVGAAVGLLAGYGWLAALLIGSLMASHTLLGFPIVERMKLVKDEAVAVTIGGTVFTDFSSLLILALCLPIHRSGFSASAFVLQIVEMTAYVVLVFVGLSALGRWLIERAGPAKERQVVLTLLIIALAGFGAEAVNLDAIIGAFVAGLAVNRALSDSAGKEELDFLGHTLFIPMFFVSIGFLIDVRVFLETLVARTGLVVGVVGGLIGAKFLAAYATRRLLGYSRNEGHMIWSLSLPQVAATLATAIVAYQSKNAQGVRLIDEPVINTVLVLVVVTSILGPTLTEYFGRQLLAEQDAAAKAAAVLPQSDVGELQDGGGRISQ